MLQTINTPVKSTASVLQRRVFRRNPDFSEDHIASIFRVKFQSKTEPAEAAGVTTQKATLCENTKH
jgi:hypothetical protein